MEGNNSNNNINDNNKNNNESDGNDDKTRVIETGALRFSNRRIGKSVPKAKKKETQTVRQLRKKFQTVLEFKTK